MPSPGDLPSPGIEPGFPTLQADSLPTELSGNPIFEIEAINRMLVSDGYNSMGRFRKHSVKHKCLMALSSFFGNTPLTIIVLG